MVSIDDFDLLCVVGKGSFGTVLQVRKKDTKEILAMKILNKRDLVQTGQVRCLLFHRKKGDVGFANKPDTPC